MNEEDKLKRIRDKIDILDERIQRLIQKRALFALKIGKIKRRMNREMTVYQPKREKQIFQNIKARNSGLLSDTQTIGIFREILNACRSVQQPIKVAYLGPEGTYSQQAMLAHFGESVSTFPVGTISDVLNAVKAQDMDYGVVPIANSTTGLISASIDILANFDLSIYGEIVLPIQHNLMSLQIENNPITHIYSHQQSFKQCAGWLQKNFPDAQKVAVESNAIAAQYAAGKPHCGAIASSAAARIYSLNILSEKINDNPNNETRFVIFGKKKDVL